MCVCVCVCVCVVLCVCVCVFVCLTVFRPFCSSCFSLLCFSFPFQSLSGFICGVVVSIIILLTVIFIFIIIIDRFYIALFSALEQTHFLLMLFLSIAFCNNISQ